jgi:hypothetical protein
MSTVVVLSPARPGRYDVRLGEEVIVRGSRDPEHDAARALLARGITGPMTTTRANGVVCMRFASIEKTAQLTISETDEGFKVRRWEAFPRERVDARTRFSELEAAE